MEPREFEQVACVLEQVLRQAGGASLRHPGRHVRRLKGDGSEVTDADSDAENVIADGLRAHFPQAAVVGEEGTRFEGSHGCWYIDPIDGTSAYADGLAYWGPTVTWMMEGRYQIGAFYLPELDRFYFAAVGYGAWCNGTRMAMRDSAMPSRHDVAYFPSRSHRVAIQWPGKVRALGSSAAHLALVAAGSGVVAGIAAWSHWDVGAGVLMIRESGGIVTRIDGSPFNPEDEEGLPFLAGASTACRTLAAALTQVRAAVGRRHEP